MLWRIGADGENEMRDDTGGADWWQQQQQIEQQQYFPTTTRQPMTKLQFTRAQRKTSRLRLALTGPSGSGKTYSALLIAKGIGGRVAVLDTERGSASLYADLLEFDTLDLDPPYTPERFAEAIEAAESAGYDTLILDSITHEWSGVGGCLELVDGIARSRYGGNSWSAWNDITPRHRAFLDTILRSRMHAIATMRSKTETAQQDGANGKKKVVKLGMKAEQRDGVEFEFTTVLDLVHDGHFAVASKDRTGLFVGDPKPITEQTGADLLAWLNTGADVQAELFARLRKAATSGTAELLRVHTTLKAAPRYAELWKAESESLKATAAQADQSAAQAQPEQVIA
jgi:hypothetical protein